MTQIGQTVTCLGEVLLRLSSPKGALLRETSALSIYYGGAEANVAIALSNFGIPSRMVSALPANDLGRGAIQNFKKFGVDTSFIAERSGRLGLYFVEEGSSVRGSKVVYDRMHSCFAELNPSDVDWEKAFNGCDWFHLSGITPAISKQAAELSVNAVKKAHEMGLKVSLDLNYRKNLWKYGAAPDEIIPQMMPYVNVLVGDPATINLMLGLKIPTSDRYSDPEELRKPYVELVAKYDNLECVGMILREVVNADHNLLQGVIYSDGNISASRTIDVNPIIERIGGGDAFTAGLIYGLKSRLGAHESVEFAIASSALKMTVEGDFSLFSADDIKEFLESKASGTISR